MLSHLSQHKSMLQSDPVNWRPLGQEETSPIKWVRQFTYLNLLIKWWIKIHKFFANETIKPIYRSPLRVSHLKILLIIQFCYPWKKIYNILNFLKVSPTFVSSRKFNIQSKSAKLFEKCLRLKKSVVAISHSPAAEMTCQLFII